MSSLNHQNTQKENEESWVVNSIEDIKNFLQSKNIKQIVIQKVMTSFMAKIAPNTKISIKENTLQIGESSLFLGEDILHNIQNIKENVKERVKNLISKK